MHAHLRQTPAAQVAQFPAAKSGSGLCAAFLPFLLNQFADVAEQPARLRRQLVQRTPQHFRRKLVRQRDVIQRDFNVTLAARQVFASPAGAGASSAMASMSVRYFSWSRRLRVRAVGNVRPGAYGLSTSTGCNSRCAFRSFFKRSLPFRPGDESRQRAPFPLQLVNAPGLLGALVHRQRQATVLQLLIEINRRRRQKNHHRAFDVVFLRHHLARAGSLPVLAMVSSPSLCKSLSA